jgi:SAM-dependent methyltransferase
MHDQVRTAWNACGEAFDRYTRAEDSYSELIERPVLLELAGDVEGSRMLDLGCGSGVYSLTFAARGASIVGVDLSETMIELARNRALELTAGQPLQAEFRVGDIGARLPFVDADFDLVFTSTALHYIQDLSPVMREAARVLRPGGRFLASVLHPMNTARFPVAGQNQNVPGWETRSKWPMSYFGRREREIETPWLGFSAVPESVPEEGTRLRCHHHSIADYFGAISSAGLQLTALREPQPPSELARDSARYAEASSIPLYLILAAALRRGKE